MKLERGRDRAAAETPPPRARRPRGAKLTEPEVRRLRDLAYEWLMREQGLSRADARRVAAAMGIDPDHLLRRRRVVAPAVERFGVGGVAARVIGGTRYGG